MAPGRGGLPAAEREVEVAAAVQRLLASVAPPTLARIRLGLRAFERLPFPWRFSRLAPAAREEFLRRMEGSRLRLHQQLLLLAKTLSNFGYATDPRVEARVGSEASCRLADGGRPAPAWDGEGPARPGASGAAPETEECDVVVVGSGAGGAVAAAILAEAGLDVVVLEAGEAHDRETYPRDRVEAVASLYRDGGLTIAAGRPPVPIPVGCALGGTTVINSGTCFRAPAEVLERWRESFGIAWATELDPAYAAAEAAMRVTPLDPERIGRNGQLALEGAAALGASAGPIARNAGACVQCSSCPYGCPLDAKRGVHVTYLPRAAAAGARLRTGVEALRVIVEDGRAVGIEGREAGGSGAGGREPRPRRVLARRATVLAGGAFGTPELLLRSGLGGPAVGRHLHVHPACWVGARYEEEVRGWEGVMQSAYVDQWEPQRILLEATFTPLPFGGAWLPGVGAAHQEAILGFDRIGSIGVHLRDDESSGRVGVAGDGSLRLSYRLTRADAERLVFGIARAAEVHFAAGAREVYPNVAGVPVLRRADLAAFEARRFSPADLRLEAFHPMGSARIAADPRQGVCAADGGVHGVAGLHVADASLFPSSVGVNPMMTVIAFATQVANGLLEA